METTANKILIVLMTAITATTAALTLGYIAHYDLGFSRQEIRTPAVVAAAVIATVMVIEFFGKKLRKPK
jgi:hypothetical protein